MHIPSWQAGGGEEGGHNWLWQARCFRQVRRKFWWMKFLLIVLLGSTTTSATTAMSPWTTTPLLRSATRSVEQSNFQFLTVNSF